MPRADVVRLRIEFLKCDRDVSICSKHVLSVTEMLEELVVHLGEHLREAARFFVL